MESDVERQTRLNDMRDHATIVRAMESNVEHQTRLSDVRDHATIARALESDVEHQTRLSNMRDHATIARALESDVVHQTRLGDMRDHATIARATESDIEHEFRLSYQRNYEADVIKNESQDERNERLENKNFNTALSLLHESDEDTCVRLEIKNYNTVLGRHFETDADTKERLGVEQNRIDQNRKSISEEQLEISKTTASILQSNKRKKTRQQFLEGVQACNTNPMASPDIDVLEHMFEQDILMARYMLYEQTGFYEYPIHREDREGVLKPDCEREFMDYLDKLRVTPERIQGCLQNFHADMDPLQPFATCAACGERGNKKRVTVAFMDLSSLKVLKVPHVKVQEVLNSEIKNAYLGIYHWYLRRGTSDEYYHLIPELEVLPELSEISGGEQKQNDNPVFPICIKCSKEIKKNQPGQEFALARNEDYGNMSKCGINTQELTIADKLAISPVRIIQTLLKICSKTRNKQTNKNDSNTAPSKDTYSGHCISFESDSFLPHTSKILNSLNQKTKLNPEDKIKLPNNDIENAFKVLFVGPKGEYELIKNNLPGWKYPVSLNKDIVIQFLECASIMNSFFVDYAEFNKEDAQLSLTNSTERILNNAVIDPRIATAELDAKMKSDISRTNDGEYIGHILIVNNSLKSSKGESARKILQCLKRAICSDEDDSKDLGMKTKAKVSYV
jgi:hypothetical protein